MVELPDFDDLTSVIELHKRIKTELELKKIELVSLRADITNFIMMNPNYWGVDKKAPSNAHIRDTYHVVGYDEMTKERLSELMMGIAKLDAEVVYIENVLELAKIRIDVWRTESANKRSSLV